MLDLTPKPSTKISSFPEDMPYGFSKASGIKPFIPKSEKLIFPFHNPISKKINLRKLRLNLFEIPH